MPGDRGVEARMGIGPVDHMAVGSTRPRRYRRSIRSRASGMRDFVVVRNNTTPNLWDHDFAALRGLRGLKGSCMDEGVCTGAIFGNSVM